MSLLAAALSLALGDLALAANNNSAAPAASETRPEPTWTLPDVMVSDLAAATGLATPAQFQQPSLPQVAASTPTLLPSAAIAANQQLYASFGVPRSALAATNLADQNLLGASFVPGGEAPIRATTDAGDLLGSSPSVLNLGIQRRNPIVTDPRVRGSRVGALAASGS
jgi:hypothetical protein